MNNNNRPITEPKFTTLETRKTENVSISYQKKYNLPRSPRNLNFHYTQPVNNLMHPQPMKNARAPIFDEREEKPRLSNRGSRDNSFNRKSFKIFDQNKNSSIYHHNKTKQMPRDNSFEVHSMNKSKSFGNRSNASYNSKNSKSPLNINLLDKGNLSNQARMSRTSRNSHREIKESINNPVILKTQLKARNAEIKYLNQRLDQIHKEREEKQLHTYTKDSEHMDNFKIKQLEKEMNDLKSRNKELKKKNTTLKHKVQKYKNDLNQQIFAMKLEYEEKSRRNMDDMEREVAFKYAEEDADLKPLKDEIIALENQLKQKK